METFWTTLTLWKFCIQIRLPLHSKIKLKILSGLMLVWKRFKRKQFRAKFKETKKANYSSIHVPTQLLKQPKATVQIIQTIQNTLPLHILSVSQAQHSISHSLLLAIIILAICEFRIKCWKVLQCSKTLHTVVAGIHETLHTVLKFSQCIMTQMEGCKGSIPPGCPLAQAEIDLLIRKKEVTKPDVQCTIQLMAKSHLYNACYM